MHIVAICLSDWEDRGNSLQVHLEQFEINLAHLLDYILNYTKLKRSEATRWFSIHICFNNCNLPRPPSRKHMKWCFQRTLNTSMHNKSWYATWRLQCVWVCLACGWFSNLRLIPWSRIRGTWMGSRGIRGAFKPRLSKWTCLLLDGHQEVKWLQLNSSIWIPARWEWISFGGRQIYSISLRQINSRCESCTTLTYCYFRCKC